MKKHFGRIWDKVLIGYVLIIVIAVSVLIYVFNVVKTIATDEDINSVPRQKIYLVTNTQSLLYESEAIGQLLDMKEEDYTYFNETLDKAQENVKELRLLVDNEKLLNEIDTISYLIERKRNNTNNLLEIWKQSNTDLYTKNIENAISKQEKLIEEKGVSERVISKKDTVKVAPKKRTFLKRLAEVFVPDNADSSIIVSANEEMMKDTLVVNTYNPQEAISNTLRNIQKNVLSERERLQKQLNDRSTAIRYDNSLISARINQILRYLEEEELNASLNRVQKRQDLLGRSTYLITGIAIFSLFLIVFMLLLIGNDFFKSKYYRKQLEQELHSREQLMLMINHDVRSPLSSVIGYVELMQRSAPTDQQIVYLNNINSSSKHILSLVNSLLDIQRLKVGKMETHLVSIRIKPFFEEIYNSLYPLARAKNLSFQLDFQELSEKIYLGDSIRIRQIVVNLVNNAIKFSDDETGAENPHGLVSITVDCSKLALDAEGEEKQSSQLRIIVRDSGPGMKKEEQDRIFKEFTRLPGTEKKEGFGLGLSITHQLVTLLGGTITVESQENVGSAFFVTLPFPLAENQTIEEPESIVIQKERHLFDRHVFCLLIDDDLMQIALIEEILKQNNIQTISCTNPRKAVELLEKNPIDIVFSDIHMPDMDGYEVIRNIRSSTIPNAKTIPIVALSGSIGVDKTLYTEAGFIDSLSKPFSASQLIDLIEKLLKPDEYHVAEKNTTGDQSDIDFSALTAFAGDDKDASDLILQTFYEETNKYITTLQNTLDMKDRVGAGEVAHKLIPLFTMLNMDTLVQQLYLIELNDPALTDSGWLRLIDDIIDQMHFIIKRINKRKRS